MRKTIFLKVVMVVLLLVPAAAHLHAEEVDKDGKTALIRAVENGQLDDATKLIEKGANVNAAGKDSLSVLSIASAIGNPQFVSLLIKKGANVNYITPIGRTGGSPINIASLNGNSEVVRVLIKNGSRIDGQTLNGESALDFAKDNKTIFIINFYGGEKRGRFISLSRTYASHSSGGNRFR